MPRQVLNELKVEALLDLYGAGWQARELADVFGASVESVSKVITGRTWQRVTQGRNVSRRAAETDYRAAVIQARMDQGVTNYAQIAHELGVTRQAVSQLVRNRGLGPGKVDKEC